MFRVGLTGGIGAGKSAAADCFKKLGIDVIDADKISQALTKKNQPAFKKMIFHFGSKIINKTGELNRKKLRDIIFSNPLEKKWLEDLLHPEIRQIMQAQAKISKTPYCILVIPLLIESENLYQWLDRILVIDAPIDLRIQRIQTRDHATKEEAELIIHQQANHEKRQTIADDWIENIGDKTQLENDIRQLHRQYIYLDTL